MIEEIEEIEEYEDYDDGGEEGADDEVIEIAAEMEDSYPDPVEIEDEHADTDIEDEEYIEFNKENVKTEASNIVSPQIFLIFIDLVVPSLIAFIVNKRLEKQGIKISASKLKFLESEKKQLEPILNELIKQVQIKADPRFLLVLALVTLYTMKTITLISVAKMTKEEKLKKK